MKPIPKIEKEVLKVYDVWLHSYLNGDVETYDKFLDDDYHFIGSTSNEEFLNRTNTTNFFAETSEQLAGKSQLRNEIKIVEQYGELVFITHLFDAWFFTGEDWSFYERFRCTNALRKNKKGWRFIYQHYSTPDSKAQEGQTIGFDQITAENLQLREAIKRRTKELEEKNRELQIEGALERIRTQAVAMQESSDLLDIVVSMRNEFITLGHEAHYFWHMMWLPDTYEKAMTSGDGTRIGFVMKLPRHIHGDIPLLAKWEKSEKPIVIYAMDAGAAIDYVDKMIHLGDFQNIDPQAPSNDDIRHIGGLTFIMARTTHGEIGYSLPGVVENPPPDSLELLGRFAGAFDLAHRRFLDLQKAEAQAREAQIEVALERIRSRSMAMHKSEELLEVISVVSDQLKQLDFRFVHVSFAINDANKSYRFWTAAKGLERPTRFETPYAELDVFKNIKNAQEKSLSFFSDIINKKEHWKWHKHLLNHGGAKIFSTEQNNVIKNRGMARSIAINTNIILIIANYASIPYSEEDNKIFDRFGKVFEQSYTRFLDLQKAENQARKAQIEAALERTRTQSMLMQRSEELDATSKVFHQQLQLLGIDTEFSYVWLPDEANKEHKFWVAWNSDKKGSSKIQSKAIVYPLDKTESYTASCFKDWASGISVHVHHIKPKEVKTFFTAWEELLKDAKNISPKYFSNGLYYAEAFMKYGCFGINIKRSITNEEKQILQRFSVEFERTYTRFLDLQKAEVQAKEAQIEAALERVRSRSMAMHNSEELKEVSALLDHEVRSLGIETWGCAFNIYGENDSSEWFSTRAGVMPPYKTPRENIFKKYYNLGKEGVTFHIQEFKGKKCVEHYEYLCTLPEAGEALRAIKESGGTFPQYQLDHVAFFKQGYLLFITLQPIPEAENIFPRFAKVFEQTYTRFLDLQKAEEQAREAQIQLSLERVRAKSMAMQSSDELHDVIGIVFQQFDNLKIQPVNVFLSLFDREKRMLTYRASGKSGNRMPTKQTVDIDSVEAWSDLYNKWINDSSDDIEVIYYPKEIVPDILNLLKDTFLAMPKKDRMTVKDFPEGGYSTLGYTPFGYIGYDHTRPPTEEEKDILTRICTEFGRVYQRFLDLKKAEAQARESKIEMTLERVRSRSMGMQKSEELEEIIQVVFDQFIQLGITVDHSGFIMDYKSRDDMHIWLADEHKITSQITLPYFDSPHWNSFNEAKKKGDNLFLNHLNFKEKNKFYKQIFKYVPDLPEDAKTFYLQCPSLTIATTLADNIGLYIENYSGIQYSEKDQKTLIRFGKVFQQTYTRFLDLTKAEAQAREAQIEAALEKVRSRTMAMQKSEELPLAANNLFQQVQELGIPAWSAGYCIWQDDKHNASCNMSSEGEIQKGFILPSIGEGYDFYNPQKKGENFYVKELGGEALVKHYEFMKELPNVGEILKELTNAGLELPTFQIFHICYFKYGYVMFITYEEVPHAHNVFKRFSQVFEQTYTRFLDLERAEAQAKEAHIEMALEKVRSRTMAMQKGEELKEVVVLLYKELIKLGVTNFVSCGYVEINEVTQRQLTWVTDPGGDSLGLFYLPLTGDATFDERYNAWKKQQEIFHQTVAGKKRKKHFEYAITTFNSKEAEEMVLSQFPDPTVFYCFNFPQGYLHIVSGSRLNKDEEMLLARFTRVFEQTYTRFLDLERAEAQAREAQIEMALEKVRSRTMAMQKSDELQDAAQVLFNEIRGLGIPSWSCGYNILSDDKKSAECWMSSEGALQKPFTLYYEKEKSFIEQYDFFKSKKTFLVQEQKGKDLEEAYAYMKTIPKIGEIIVDLEQSGISLPTHQFNHLCKFNKGYLLFITYEPVPEAHELFVRFTKVFDQTYTRFLDLKDAEARARESKIQAALERVRSRSMGMQTTADFGEVTTEMFNQLRNFGEDLFATGIVFCDKHEGHVEQWHSIPGGGMLSPMIVPIDLDYIHQYRYNQWKAGKELFSIEIPSDFIVRHFEDIFKLPSAQITLKDLEARNAPMPAPPSWEIDYGASFNHGYILISSLKPLENTDILPRFAKVFEQAYTRFLDLQKAEEQAREAKIEASLERVRAKTMAMHKSEDLSEVATVLFEQISLLTETPSRFNIAILNEEEQLFDIWVTDQKGHNLNKLFVFDVQKSEIVAEVYKAFQAKEKHIIQHMSGERLKNWIEYASKEAGVPFNKADIKEDRYINSIFFKHGCIGITTDEIPDESVIQLLERFTKVFEQTFTRFLDLEKAEAQAREAKIEAALEKVRSRSLAMHQSTEMQKVVNEIQEQVRSLGLNIDALAMSGVIDNEADYDVWVGGANSQKPLRIPYNNDTKIQRDFNKAIKERPDLFTNTYTGKVMKDYFKALMGTGNSFNPEIEQFMLTCTGFTTTLTFMKNSGIQIIRYTEESFSDTDNAIVIRFGKVFEQAYIRFLDLQKAEAQTLLAEQNLIQLKTEKQRAEEALSELQQTQNQLIQSEKMASLGELTAGIAHEIQNPLNFVNNFSEVSKELLEEMQEEIENGDFEEVKAIMEDVIQNLEKINHHGKRADGIVKGMLQHSRSSTGTKEPTDINALADEYLRLAYHGLRAKDKSFNAELITDFDDSIGNINVIPQDMGRVILNLITNAFYASNERKQASKVQGFKPIVSVRTKKTGDHLEIKVTDNGNGIPKEVVDKIFQPFFTTKPTGQGTGLGLSMSYDIVTKGHGGELKVETVENKGTTFNIILKLDQ